MQASSKSPPVSTYTNVVGGKVDVQQASQDDDNDDEMSTESDEHSQYAAYLKPYIVISKILNSEKLRLQKFKESERKRIRLLGFHVLDITEDAEVRFYKNDRVVVVNGVNSLAKGCISRSRLISTYLTPPHRVSSLPPPTPLSHTE